MWDFPMGFHEMFNLQRFGDVRFYSRFSNLKNNVGRATSNLISRLRNVGPR